MSVATAGADRRLDIGKVLQDGLGVLQRNIVQFGLMALLLQGIPTILVGVGQVMSRTNPIFAIFSVLGFIGYIVCIPMVQAGLVYGTMRDLDGSPASTDECLKVGRQRWLMLLGLGILEGLALGLGFLFLIVPGVLLALRWSVAGPIVVLEGRGIQESMGRSATLTKGYRGSIFLLALIYFVIFLIFETILAIAAGGLAAIATNPLVATIISPVFSICSTLLVTTVFTALFRELRRTKEGDRADTLAEVFA